MAIEWLVRNASSQARNANSLSEPLTGFMLFPAEIEAHCYTVNASGVPVFLDKWIKDEGSCLARVRSGGGKLL